MLQGVPEPWQSEEVLFEKGTFKLRSEYKKEPSSLFLQPI